jgi:hypothetical protein
MTIWKVANSHKKMCEEREIWTKDDKTIIRINGFRWGTFTVETNNGEPPEDIDPENPDGINMYDYFSDNADNGAELESMDDGCYLDYEFNGIDEEEQEELQAAMEDDHYEYLEGNGWYNSETEAWLYGPLEITKEN